jgi:iron complex outermembrane receptor protein
MFFQPMGLKVFAGLRRTFADRVAVGNPPGEFAATNTSWDLGAALNLGAASEVFGKIGNSFRLPNANEYTCYVQYCPGGADKLLPQLSKDMELGFRQKPVWGQWTARLYRSNLTREIGYDPMIGNVNFDPTRREGIELDASTKLANQLDGGLQFAVRSASFRSGSYAGKTIPLVANRLLTARLVYRQSGTQRWLLTSQLVSAQRIGDDFDNTGNSKIAGYATLNLRYSHKVDAWTYAATANNLLDKRYFNYRTYSDETAKSVYPEAGRTFLVSAQRSF